MNINRKLGLFYGVLWRKKRFRTFMRWFFYSLALLLFYMIMVSGFFRGWQPVLIIPLAVAVAMHERELSASIFGAVCGLVIDVAFGKLFGFSGTWLLPGCLAAALLVSHLIKINLLNFLWVNAAMCAVMATADYFFGYILWDVSNAHYVLVNIIIPANVATVICSPLIYLGVKHISVNLSPFERYHVALNDNKEDE